MPYVLDYDGAGNVTGGHFVEQLQQNPLRATPYYGTMRNPLYEPPHRQSSSPNTMSETAYPQPLFAPIYQAPERMPSPVQSKGAVFLARFNRHFAGDMSTMATFETLCADYNQKIADETDLYVGIFMILSRTESWNLLPELVDVLPASWKAKDLSWLHQAAEARFVGGGTAMGPVSSTSSANAERISSDRDNFPALERSSPATAERMSPVPTIVASPAKRTKRPPAKGFRTSHSSATTDHQPMFVDPAALMLHQPVTDSMPDSDDGMDTSMDANGFPIRKGLVKLKLPKSATGGGPLRRVAQKGPPKAQEITDPDAYINEPVDESVKSVKRGKKAKKTTAHKLSSQVTLSRKGRARYGEMFAKDIDHFGHFPTRRAVIARASRPYVHLSCGRGFSHPSDMKDHHRNKERSSGGGCPGKDGVPQGEDDKWDAHPSARVGYTDLNYTKVKDGYVLLDRESREKLDNAIAAGLEYINERRKHNKGNLSDYGANEETEMVTEEVEVTQEDIGMDAPIAEEA